MKVNANPARMVWRLDSGLPSLIPLCSPDIAESYDSNFNVAPDPKGTDQRPMESVWIMFAFTLGLAVRQVGLPKTSSRWAARIVLYHRNQLQAWKTFEYEHTEGKGKTDSFGKICHDA